MTATAVPTATELFPLTTTGTARARSKKYLSDEWDKHILPRLREGQEAKTALPSFNYLHEVHNATRELLGGDIRDWPIDTDRALALYPRLLMTKTDNALWPSHEQLISCLEYLQVEAQSPAIQEEINRLKAMPVPVEPGMVPEFLWFNRLGKKSFSSLVTGCRRLIELPKDKTDLITKIMLTAMYDFTQSVSGKGTTALQQLVDGLKQGQQLLFRISVEPHTFMRLGCFQDVDTNSCYGPTAGNGRLALLLASQPDSIVATLGYNTSTANFHVVGRSWGRLTAQNICLSNFYPNGQGFALPFLSLLMVGMGIDQIENAYTVLNNHLYRAKEEKGQGSTLPWNDGGANFLYHNGDLMVYPHKGSAIPASELLQIPKVHSTVPWHSQYKFDRYTH